MEASGNTLSVWNRVQSDSCLRRSVTILWGYIVHVKGVLTYDSWNCVGNVTALINNYISVTKLCVTWTSTLLWRGIPNRLNYCVIFILIYLYVCDRRGPHNTTWRAAWSPRFAAWRPMLCNTWNDVPRTLKLRNTYRWCSQGKGFLGGRRSGIEDFPKQSDEERTSSSSARNWT